mmetsp:Transcript_8980/g.22740  ORF Transcript_8980/g.22740 Transcript_8980/m.22740 type:complete len:278 (+) Transcript_8980:38-871(+)
MTAPKETKCSTCSLGLGEDAMCTGFATIGWPWNLETKSTKKSPYGPMDKKRTRKKKSKDMQTTLEEMLDKPGSADERDSSVGTPRSSIGPRSSPRLSNKSSASRGSPVDDGRQEGRGSPRYSKGSKASSVDDGRYASQAGRQDEDRDYKSEPYVKPESSVDPVLRSMSDGPNMACSDDDDDDDTDTAEANPSLFAYIRNKCRPSADSTRIVKRAAKKKAWPGRPRRKSRALRLKLKLRNLFGGRNDNTQLSPPAAHNSHRPSAWHTHRAHSWKWRVR